MAGAKFIAEFKAGDKVRLRATSNCVQAAYLPSGIQGEVVRSYFAPYGITLRETVDILFPGINPADPSKEGVPIEITQFPASQIEKA